jgi:putative transcriptional regulator
MEPREPKYSARYKPLGKVADSATLTARDAQVQEAPLFTQNRIATLRERLSMSQSVFAAALNVSSETVKAWEQGKRVPDGAALRLLQLAEEHPDWIAASVRTATRFDARNDRGASERGRE